MAIFGHGCTNPALGRDIQAFPLLWLHEGGPWACSHTGYGPMNRGVSKLWHDPSPPQGNANSMMGTSSLHGSMYPSSRGFKIIYM